MSSLKEFAHDWAQSSTLTKYLIISVMGLVAFAYLPTLQFDYVTQDQWRAFRYPLSINTPLELLKECSSGLSAHYTQSGRPLLWPTECLEHAFVSEISDFRYSRPLALTLVIFTVLYLSLILKKHMREWVDALVVAAIFVTAPAYSFMYLIGLPALMVLLSACLAAASYKRFISNTNRTTNSYKLLSSASAFFLAACLIYPAFAFIVLPLALIRFVGENEILFTQRTRNLFITLVFYSALSAVYYLLVKLSILSLEYFKGSLPSVGLYEFSAQLSPTVILNRINEVATYFFMMPPANFHTLHGVTLAILIIFSIMAGIKFSSIDRSRGHTRYIYYSIATFLVSSMVLLASTSPWLVSKMDVLQTRYLLSFYLFISFAIVWIARELLSMISKQTSTKIYLVIGIVIFLPAALEQNKLSFMEVISTRAEIEFLRAKIFDWSVTEGPVEKRFILIVRPEVCRPLGVDKLIQHDKYGNDNAVMASCKNPVSIPWMVNAVLAEAHKIPKHSVVDCGFDTESCVQGALVNKNNIVLAYTGGTPYPRNKTIARKKVINSPIQPYIINFSELTSRVSNPTIKVVDIPSISATSVMDQYGPEGLFMQIPPGWHAEKHPTYPQTLKIDFKEIKSFDSISFLPQDPTVIARSPKNVRIKVSNDEQTWAEVESSNDVCTSNAPEGWHKLQLPKKLDARYLKVEILENCGDPELLTLRGLRIN